MYRQEWLDFVGLCLHVSLMYRSPSLFILHSQSLFLFGPDTSFSISRSVFDHVFHRQPGNSNPCPPAVDGHPSFPST
jgi:hypothetical protein